MSWLPEALADARPQCQYCADFFATAVGTAAAEAVPNAPTPALDVELLPTAAGASGTTPNAHRALCFLLSVRYMCRDDEITNRALTATTGSSPL